MEPTPLEAFVVECVKRGLPPDKIYQEKIHTYALMLDGLPDDVLDRASRRLNSRGLDEAFEYVGYQRRRLGL